MLALALGPRPRAPRPRRPDARPRRRRAPRASTRRSSASSPTGGTTVFLTTHDLAGFEGIATRVGILKEGRLVLDEEPRVAQGPVPPHPVRQPPDRDADRLRHGARRLRRRARPRARLGHRRDRVELRRTGLRAVQERSTASTTRRPRRCRSRRSSSQSRARRRRRRRHEGISRDLSAGVRRAPERSSGPRRSTSLIPRRRAGVTRSRRPDAVRPAALDRADLFSGRLRASALPWRSGFRCSFRESRTRRIAFDFHGPYPATSIWVGLVAAATALAPARPESSWTAAWLAGLGTSPGATSGQNPSRHGSLLLAALSRRSR